MSGKIPRAFIEDLLVRVDLVDLIETHVPLKKTGSNFVARCPFHVEKSPSFSVNRNKQLYHCFGCGASGDALGFLMAFNHLSFVEAVEDLAVFVGVPMPREVFRETMDDSRTLESIYSVLREVAEFYSEQLRFTPEAKKAVDYLKARGVEAENIKEFMLGYAADEWQSLEARFDKQALQDAGLLVQNDDGRTYNRFRGRLMFPIRDKRDRVVGFGARVLDDSVPKYLNSPETKVFQKGHEAYGLFELLKKNARPARMVIVEGYMDVIALAQAGIHYAVATLGTATSKAHLDLLFRYAPELVLCFDGDAAGRQAAWRAMDVVFSSIKEGRIVKVMLLPQGDDPDSLIKKEGGDQFVARITGAQALSDYFFDSLSSQVNMADIEGRARFVTIAQPFINKLPDGIFKQMMFARLHELGQGGFKPSISQVVEARLSHPVEKGRMTPIRMAIALLLQNPHLVDLLEQREVAWQEFDFPGAALLNDIVTVILEKRPANSALLLSLFRETPNYDLVKLLLNLQLWVSDQELEIVFNGVLDRLIDGAHRMQFERLLQRLEQVGVAGLTPAERAALKKNS